jgi:hypothetical protein
VNLVRVHAFFVEKADDNSLIMLHSWSKNYTFTGSKRIISPSLSIREMVFDIPCRILW